MLLMCQCADLPASKRDVAVRVLQRAVGKAHMDDEDGGRGTPKGKPQAAGECY
jgi:hypothetical protein